jgi:hypothetical protein
VICVWAARNASENYINGLIVATLGNKDRNKIIEVDEKLEMNAKPSP